MANTNSTYTVTGRITNPDGQPLQSLTVHAYVQNPKTSDILVEHKTETDADGKYTVQFTEKDFPSDGVARGGVEVFIRVYAGDKLLRESPVARLSEPNLTINLQVDYFKPDPNEPARQVYGVVRDADGNPLRDIAVHAFDRDLRHDEPLGQGQTNEAGHFQIEYFIWQFRNREKDGADLVIKVIAADGSELVTSPVIFNAPETVERDLTVPANLLQPLSLFERIAQALDPLLGDVQVIELDEGKEYQDLSFLAGETGFEQRDLARFVLAHRLQQESLRPEFWFSLLRGSFFKYTADQSLTPQMEAVLGALSSLNRTTVRKVLTGGFNSRDISSSLRDNLDKWIEAFFQFVAGRLISATDNPTFVKSALDDAGITSATKLAKFARLYNEHKAMTPELLTALTKDRTFKKEEIADLHASFQLADLTQSDFSVVRAIKDAFEVRRPEQVRLLAKKSETEWVGLIKEHHAAGEIKLPIEVEQFPIEAQFPSAEMYGKMLERRFREAFPTTAFVGGLERALNNGGAHGLRQAEALSRFLDAHAGFEFLKTPVDNFFSKDVHPEFRELAKDENFKLEVKAVQRVFKLAPNFEATDTLLADEVHSAQQIYRMGENEFVERYASKPGFNADTARTAWNRAADTYAAVLTIVSDLKAMDGNAQPASLRGNTNALETFPNWNNLFQGGDLCDCDDCRSVLSLPAYYADLLMFLRDRNVLDVLYSRRADLGFLELSCENAQTSLPYIDVVCEVLEKVVAGDKNNLDLGFSTMPSDPVLAKQNVKRAFERRGINLGADYSLVEVHSNIPDCWVAHGDSVTYLLKKDTSPNFVAEVLPNTKVSASELRAYPQYVNQEAYAKLRSAKHPFTLPFDLFSTEVRAAFQSAQIQRWNLMRTFRGLDASNLPSPTEGEIAAEYFGISANPHDPMDEKRLITQQMSGSSEQQEIWGEAGNPAWRHKLRIVKTFLHKTGLEYNELLALFDLKFINPDGDISIDIYVNPPCDLDKQVIHGLDAPKLDRIHRFLRLWRKLKGWQMWELDLFIDHDCGGKTLITEQLLINLFYFCEVKNKLGSKTTVEQTLALFGKLNTRTHFTKLNEKRADGLYQHLFLNRELIQPLDSALAIEKVEASAPPFKQISQHRPAVLAALGIGEADLALLQGLKYPSGPSYINDDLNLENLSFLWRHSWLSKRLKFKLQDWRLVLKLMNQPLGIFASTKFAYGFLETIDVLNATGFTIDELNWLLTADRSAKAAVKEAETARFLLGLRKELQTIQADYDPAQYAFLNAQPPTDEGQLTALLTNVLRALNRQDAEMNAFLAVLRGRMVLETPVEGMQTSFAFPTAITGQPNYIPIEYDAPASVFRFTGMMTEAQNALLLDESGATLTALRGSGTLEAPAPGLPASFAFPTHITGAPNNIPIQYDRAQAVFRFTGLMTDTQYAILIDSASLTLPGYRTGIEGLYQQSLAILNRIAAYRRAIDDLFQQSATAATTYATAQVTLDPQATFSLPPHQPSIPATYDPASHRLSFIGVMTPAEQSDLKSVAGNPSTAIDELFQIPRLAVKFYQPIFTAPLEILPSIVDFKAQLSAALAVKISYDAEQRLLLFSGIMTKADKAALDLLAPATETAYHSAVDSLAALPLSIVPPDDRIWMSSSDLDATQPANDTTAKRLANAIQKGLVYLKQTLSADTVINQASAQLGLTEAFTQRLFTFYPVLPDTLMTHFIRTFAATTGTVDYATLKTTFDAWFWACRVATLCKRWKLKLEELNSIIRFVTNAQLLDFNKLPLTDANPTAPFDQFNRISRLMRLRDDLPETEITLFKVLDKVNNRGYQATADVVGMPAGFTFPGAITGGANGIPIQYDEANQILRYTGLMSAAERKRLLSDASLAAVTGIEAYWKAIDHLFESLQQAFAADVERLNEDWHQADAETLISALDLVYPAQYLLVENWERLRHVFDFLNTLNAGAATVKPFAASGMSPDDVRIIKELLRSKFGTETWLSVCAEIQDALRERKRDALAAYILTLTPPTDAPTGKWENTNDLYAYYLIDVEMESCQLTSRLVQGAGSIQLYVQRCLMGLEPDPQVKASMKSGDSAWNWWKWMRKYRVWEANVKVFLWPENWIEPELKKDRSVFFKEMEDELLQNDVDQNTAEVALAHYLEKMNSVGQLEIAGFYQEDIGYDTIIHVFGRTLGEPHLYYYRRYDYHEWTPWEKVETDIQSDYLIPAMINSRLYLFWPVFKEVPDETANTTVKVPSASQRTFAPDKAGKRLHMQMAVSEYRQGKWTPKKVSKNYAESDDSSGLWSNLKSYNTEIVNKYYHFFTFEEEERFYIIYTGYSSDTAGDRGAALYGRIEISNCTGAGDLTFGDAPLDMYSISPLIVPEEARFLANSLKWMEFPSRSGAELGQNDFSLFIGGFGILPVLMQTPGLFKMAPAWHFSYMDKLLPPFLRNAFGSWLPYFYSDQTHTFMVLPSTTGNPDKQVGPSFDPRAYYPEIKASLLSDEAYFAADVNYWVDSFVAALDPTEQDILSDWLTEGEGIELPISEAELKQRIRAFPMRAVDFFLNNLDDYLLPLQQFRFKSFYHPFVCDFATLVNNPLKGTPALLSRANQMKDSGFSFRRDYAPTANVVEQGTEVYYPSEVVDFTLDGAYSSYNWELFFHAPLLIANLLSKNQRFEEARDWYHYIFNPLGVESPLPGRPPMSKYWITKPFFETTAPEYLQQRIDMIMRLLAKDTSVVDTSGMTPQEKAEAIFQAFNAIETAVLDWRTNPFEPHRIARYRTVAYQKTVVMKYLDNLIAWGDNLFRQDSMESINEATQLYITAAEILGTRPESIPTPANAPVESFNELQDRFQLYANAIVNVENIMPVFNGNRPGAGNRPLLPTLYFCIPQNDKLLNYWDIVADRLYKIRNCMNIDGVVRQLALFEPPIEPGALVKALAGGLDIGAALADLNAPLPLYRFNMLLQKANEMCNDVKALGGALLAALEKKDAEELNRLRQGQEIHLLEAVKAVRQSQLEEAQETLEGLKKSRIVVEARQAYYKSIERISSGEQLSLKKQQTAFEHQTKAQSYNIYASLLGLVPNLTFGGSGIGGSPHVTAQWGTGNIISALQAMSTFETQLGSAASYEAGSASTLAGYERRYNDWMLQAELATKELDQLDRQIAAAERRVSIADKELQNQALQIDNAQANLEFMRSKYTNQELYQWQIGQISGVYFQSYRLAYDLAKRAEKCFRFELGLQDSSYINFGYWDSLKKGLLSGEKLQYDLRRLEAAYMEKNRREFELTKHISLNLLDPLALVKLRETGRCFLQLPEEIFDLDYPGHYFRRIKSVSLTLPCVVGPYTTISCTLRLLNNSIRTNTRIVHGYEHNADDNHVPTDDDRFIENTIAVKAIAASNAQNDSGVFELNFRDERYLPFEGAGAISQWSLELFHDLPSNNPDFGKPLRQFDYNTISDVVLHLKYTAREDAGAFKNAAVNHLHDYFAFNQKLPAHSVRSFNLRQEFPNQWYRFLHPTMPANGNVFEFELSPNLFSWRDGDKTLKVDTIWLLARCTNSGNYSVVLNPPLPGSDTMTLIQLNQYGGLHFSQKNVSARGIEITPTAPPDVWQLKMMSPGGGNLKKDATRQVMEVEDLFLVLGYGWELGGQE